MIKESPRQVIIDTVSFQRPARLARDLWVLPAAGKKFEKTPFPDVDLSRYRL